MRLLLLLGCATPPAPPCDLAWMELSALRDELAPTNPALRAPNQDAFRAACEALPAEARRCLPLTARLDEYPRCRAVLDGVPAETRRRFDTLLSPSAP